MAEPANPAAEPVLERGSYEILRDRLLAQAKTLGEKATALNQKRLAIFGGAEMAVVGSERLRTENNCVPRDIVALGDRMLFGFNVFVGLRAETKVGDVLSLHRCERGDNGEIRFPPVEPDFLADPRFVKDFSELYHYYKESRLQQLRRAEGRLLITFQTAAAVADVKVLRFSVDPNGVTAYIDNRGERDRVPPPAHDFEWTTTTRANHVAGRFPHVSILDEVFVETIRGDLTIKVENNTATGEGIHSEPVDDPNQSLEDADIQYAKVGPAILLRIRPYKEEVWRHLIFNTGTKTAVRIDAIGVSCVRLPEDHGLIFPGGYYLASGETKTFDGDWNGFALDASYRSPNGEDVLYVFHRREDGRSMLLAYNLIRKDVATPLLASGYSLFEDGTLVLLRAAAEPTRVHNLQVWRTPFMTSEYAAKKPSTGSFLEVVGNADLVRGISDAFSLRKQVETQAASRTTYEGLVKAAQRALDSYHWLDHAEVGDLLSTLKEIRATSELVIDEFEKVESIRADSRRAVDGLEKELGELIAGLTPDQWTSVEPFVESLGRLRRARGRLISTRDLRYVDRPRLDALEARLVEQIGALSGRAIEFLRSPGALKPYLERIEALATKGEGIGRVVDAVPIADEVQRVADGLDTLTEVVGSLEIDDAIVRTEIFESISETLAAANRARALLEARRKELLAKESMAEFGAQFKVFSQAVTGALAAADSPESSDRQLAKILLQLEELDGRFGEIDELVGQLTAKREEVTEAFAKRRQQLLDERQRRAQHVMEAAERVLTGIVRRSQTFANPDELNAWFAGDPMVTKLRDLAGRLRDLGDPVRADELESRLKAARTDAGRSVRDRQEIYEDGAGVLRLGKHRFSVNAQAIDLTLVPRGEGMALHITGTDFFEPIDDAEFASTRDFWSQALISETDDVARAEYLAATLLADAEEGRGGLTLAALEQAALAGGEALLEQVRQHATARYDEGYERGIHDADATLILAKLLVLYRKAGLLRFAPRPRAIGGLYWGTLEDRGERSSWVTRARSLVHLREVFHRSPAIDRFVAELASRVSAFAGGHRIGLASEEAHMAAAYLFEELAKSSESFVTSAEAVALRDAFLRHLRDHGAERAFQDDLTRLEADLALKWELAQAWLSGFLARTDDAAVKASAPALDEAAELLVAERKLTRTVASAAGTVVVDGLLGQHPRIAGRKLELRLDEFLFRLGRFRHVRVPGYKAYQQKRHALIEKHRKRLRLSEFKPGVMSSFVRNRLIDEVYLPLIGDNLAKQIGTVGEGKRTDLMGMLLLISPPGYGKTTLMEYVANRLGLVFMKINGPAMGHAVTSLDPAEAPNATARQEVEKINLALEMASNVLLYIDDIQHTNAELLQKFISLCDAQRKIEGVYRGETKTYDLRGRRFAVCMAGNPYTESGQRFQIPDMLANRSDVYNIGDILVGREELFALSYVENALTSNPVLAPLASRDLADVHRLVRMARGEEVAVDELSHDYSAAEVEEILAVLRKLQRVQQVLLEVNQQYIASAAQEDAYRTEPRFQLQGSYRNMNKLAEKVAAVMNEAELEALIDDHYAGEAQTLTTGAEQNLLKLAELRERQTPVQQARWAEIKRAFERVQTTGGKTDDPVARVTGQLGLLSERLHGIGAAIVEAAGRPSAGPDFAPLLAKLQESMAAMAAARPAADASLRFLEQAEATKVDLGELKAPLASLDARLSEIGKILQVAARSVLAEMEKAPRATTVAPVEHAGAELAPYLERLNQAVSGLSKAGGSTTQIIQALPPGVYDLMGKMIATIDASMIPLLRGVARKIKGTPIEADAKLMNLMDKSLKNFDVLKDLVAALQKIDTAARLPRGEPPLPADE